MENKCKISDELLAAYLDGNTNEAETQKVLNALKAAPELREALDIAIRIEDSETAAYNVLPMMKLAAESGNNICSVLCEASILHRRGIAFKESDLLEKAQKGKWLTPHGTPLHAIGQLLVDYSQMVTRKYDATLQDIENALAVDNDVIAVVDSDKLYENREDLEDAPNHAIVVKGIDLSTETISIFDPQENAILNIQCDLFEEAWKESRHYMVRVLQTIDDYEPHPINLDDISLTDDLQELQEAIAENAHDVWAEARIKEGWSYGKTRDDANKKHPDLIPYSSLPDGEKEYDRLMAFKTIKLVKKLGFDIVKRDR